MCNSCNSFFCGIANALDNLFAVPANNGGCGCNNGNNGCGCNGTNAIAGTLNNLFGNGGCGCNNGNNGCGCNNGCGNYDDYYAQQYALGPYRVPCNICGF